MALFTGKGDDGTTYAFGCNQRFSKSSEIAEALGSLDELNSYLGLVKLTSKKKSETNHDFNIKFSNDKNFADIIYEIQQNLFIIQAEVAGANKKITSDKIKDAEQIINEIEKLLPPIKTFFISGGSELATLFDYARTIARRTERSVVKAVDSGGEIISKETLAYLNRLSSLLYALARLSNHLSGIKEEAPNYK